MSLLSLGDTAFALRFLRLLTMPWEKTAAFKSGVIDVNGLKVKSAESKEEKESYTIFHRLVFNLRRLLAKVPLGKSSLARYGAALWLVKEHTGLSEVEIGRILYEAYGVDPRDLEVIHEDNTALFKSGVLRSDAISPFDGEYIRSQGDQIEIVESAGKIFDMPIYKALHLKSKSIIYITMEDINYAD